MLTSRIEAALASVAVRIDHIGFTSVPGLVGKDCVDLQVLVRNLDADLIVRLVAGSGWCRSPRGDRSAGR